jgi:SAM-dependent methyltransferase
MSDRRELADGGFAHGARYNGARPGYPRDAVDFFVTTFSLDATSHVLDLGAGTGIFTRQLLGHVGRVTAVEPSVSMRASFEAETPGVEIRDGSDVAIPLGDDVVAAVFVAQAFHWFDAPHALLEIHRVLRPGGHLGLIWNERDTQETWIRDLNHAMRWDVHFPYDPGVDYAAIVASGPFHDVTRRVFRHRESLSHAHVVQRVLTTSYITLMGDDERAALLKDVGSVLVAMDDPIEMPYVTNVYAATANHDE